MGKQNCTVPMSCMENRICTVVMEYTRFEQVNALLGIEDIAELSEQQKTELGVVEHEETDLLHTRFPDGTEIVLLLCSGMHNYYTALEYRLPGQEEYQSTMDCAFDLSEQETFIINEREYQVNIVFSAKEDVSP